jgi:hypothetical protein
VAAIDKSAEMMRASRLRRKEDGGAADKAIRDSRRHVMQVMPSFARRGVRVMPSFVPA